MKKIKKEKINKTKKKPVVKTQDNVKIFKQKYFEFYDDIKDYTRGKEDW